MTRFTFSVGGLGREHHGDQQLDLAGEAEGDLGVGVLGREALDQGLDPLLRRSDTAPRLDRVVARRHQSAAGTRLGGGGAPGRPIPAQTTPFAGQSEQTRAARPGRELAALHLRDRLAQLAPELVRVPGAVDPG